MAATNIHIPAVRFMTPPPCEIRNSKSEKFSAFLGALSGSIPHQITAEVAEKRRVFEFRISNFPSGLKAPFFRHVVLDILDKKSR
jgi:hypothetical protein